MQLSNMEPIPYRNYSAEPLRYLNSIIWNGFHIKIKNAAKMSGEQCEEEKS